MPDPAKRHFAIIPDVTGCVEWFGAAASARDACEAYLAVPRGPGSGYVLERVEEAGGRGNVQGGGNAQDGVMLAVREVSHEVRRALASLAPEDPRSTATLTKLAPLAATFEAVMVRRWLQGLQRKITASQVEPYPEVQARDRIWESLLVEFTGDPAVQMTPLGGVWAHGRDLTDRELLRLARHLRRLCR